MTLMPDGTLTLPRVSSPYGPRTGGTYSFHYGADMVGYSQLRAIMGGKVTFAGKYNDTAGNIVAIDSYDPVEKRTVTIVRMHVADGTIKVRTGDVVSEGTVLGIMGDTGFAFGACDHVEIRYWSGKSFTTQDPVAWLKKRVAAVGSGAGTVTLAEDQRRTKAITNGRVKPTSQSDLTGDPLQVGVVGNFVGWIRGEKVDGNDVWFKGTSGRWFWSGGFEGGARTTGLADLNAPALSATQRQVVADAVANGRTEAATTASIAQTLPAGTVGNFDGWKTGQVVEGNSVWFRGATSGDWFWSGGFVGGPDKTGLADLNPKIPAETNFRRTRFDLNGRTGPSTAFPAVQTLAEGTGGRFSHWATGQEVTIGGVTSNVWFKGLIYGNWFAAAGFTSQSTEGLQREANPPSTPAPQPVVDNPRGLKTYEPVIPFADHGLVAPLGFHDLEMTKPALRNTKGSPAQNVAPIIDRLILHWTGVLPDQLDYFSWKNDRSVCPTVFLRPDAESFEMIRPGYKPATTGPEWNWRSISVEMQMVAGDKPITEAQIEWVARLAAYMRSVDGKTWDGVPVSFKIDRTHIIGHREALPGTTECPGDYFMRQIDYVVARAQAIYEAEYAPEPTPEPGRTIVVNVVDVKNALEVAQEVVRRIEVLGA